MADSLPNLSPDAARATEPKRRFQRRLPSAETLQEIYEQNVLGATAGFFCAVWAGRLMGEHFSSTFTTVGYEDVDRPHYHHFGAKDVALVVLVASKLLFARICAIRYILRPLLNARLSGWDFTRRVQLAAAAYTALVQLLSVGAGLWTCYPILGGRRMVYEPLASVSVGTKLAVVVQCALQIAEVAVQLVEDSDSKSMLHTKLGALLTLGTIAASSYQGLVPP
ncbi:hypothetical protein LPJ63_002657 [Coemansia sp. RSA 2711]|nr:hypothetical protein LPJ63_002657 [Coemansia sp. RSA 2711]